MEYKLRRNFRNARIAYLIRENDENGFREAVLLSGTQWGGIRNLIIPVTVDNKLDPYCEYLIRICEPEYFVSVLSNGLDYVSNDLLHRRIQELLPHRQVGINPFKTFSQNDPTLHALSAFPSPVLQTNELTVHSFAGSEHDRLILLAVFGAIYPKQHAYYRENIKLTTNKVRTRDTDFWQKQFDCNVFGSVLNFTGRNLSPNKVYGGHDDLRFDIIVGDSILSLCTYWNLRAVAEATRFAFEPGRRVFLLPPALLKDQETLTSLYDFIQPKVVRPGYKTNLHVIFSVSDTSAADLLNAQLGKSTAYVELRGRHINSTLGSSRHNRPVSFRAPRRLAYLVENPISRYSIPGSFQEGVHYEQPLWTSVKFGRNDVLIQPPPAFHNPHHSNCMLDLESALWDMYPKKQSIASFIHPQGRFSRYGLSVEVAFTNRQDYLALNLPTEWQTLEHYFAEYGYDIELSPDGKYAMSFVNLIGGFENLAKVLRNDLYQMLLSLTPRSPTKLAQHIAKHIHVENQNTNDLIGDIVEALRDSDVALEFNRKPKTSAELMQLLRDTHHLTVDTEDFFSALQALVDLGVLKRGYYIPCRTCSTQSWHAITELNEVLTCPGCLDSFPFPVNRGDSDLKWHFWASPEKVDERKTLIYNTGDQVNDA